MIFCSVGDIVVDALKFSPVPLSVLMQDVNICWRLRKLQCGGSFATGSARLAAFARLALALGVQ